jgi:hypothetical protein
LLQELVLDVDLIMQDVQLIGQDLALVLHLGRRLVGGLQG